MRSIRVVVADDDATIRDALAIVLEADRRFLVVGTVADGADLPAFVDRTRPDVVLLDVRMPAGGPDAVRRLRDPARSRDAGPPPVVVAISADTSAATVVGMIEAGAVGFLAKGRVGGTLPDLLARCAEGEQVLAVPSAAEALRQLRRPAREVPAVP